MKSDPLIWATIESEIQRYKILDNENNLVPDETNQKIVKRILTALRLFFQYNNLLNINIINQSGEIIDRERRMSHFTREGMELQKSKVPNWLESKGAKKNPPDMSILSKQLETIRSSR